jgi:hypothetical protein
VSALSQARRAFSRGRHYARKVREGSHPRWQANLVRPLIRRMAQRRMLSFDALLRLEWVSRRLLGQSLSLAAWDRMTFNDKLAYRRLRVRDPAYQIFCDKLRMRDYVAERLGAENLPQLLAVGERASEFRARKGPYVLKANHGSGMVTFVTEAQVLSEDQLREAESWLATDYAWGQLEWGYQGARRLLLAEELLRGQDGSTPPPDFKLFTFDGQVVMIEVHTGRFTDHRVMMRRPDWTLIEARWVYRLPDRTDWPRPPNLDRMLDFASHLGRGIDFLRVDLYELGDRVVVGELTTCPAAGDDKFDPQTLDASLGRMWRRRPRQLRSPGVGAVTGSGGSSRLSARPSAATPGRPAGSRSRPRPGPAAR